MDKKSQDITYCIIPDNTLLGDKYRQLELCKKLNGKVYNNFSHHRYKLHSCNNIFFTDKIKLYDLVKILFQKKEKVFCNILELHSLSYKDYIQEIYYEIKSNENFFYNFFSYLKNIFFDFLKIFLIKYIINSSKSDIFIPSNLRIKYLNKFNNLKTNFILIKNLPSKKYIKFYSNKDLNLELLKYEKLFNKKIFFFINGNINNLNDLVTLCNFCNKKELSIVISTKQHKILSFIKEKYPNVIIDAGYINNNSILFYIISKSIGGVCFYNNLTPNQINSSSTKLYEFIVMSKIVIHSNNNGIKAEISELPNDVNLNLFYQIDEIEKINLNENTKNLHYSELIFENYYSHLKFFTKKSKKS